MRRRIRKLYIQLNIARKRRGKDYTIKCRKEMERKEKGGLFKLDVLLKRKRKVKERKGRRLRKPMFP